MYIYIKKTISLHLYLQKQQKRVQCIDNITNILCVLCNFPIRTENIPSTLLSLTIINGWLSVTVWGFVVKEASSKSLDCSRSRTTQNCSNSVQSLKPLSLAAVPELYTTHHTTHTALYLNNIVCESHKPRSLYTQSLLLCYCVWKQVTPKVDLYSLQWINNVNRFSTVP